MLFLKGNVNSKKLIIVSLTIIISITLLAILGPIFSKYNYYSQNLDMTNQPVSIKHWFGTDKLGRDIFTRIAYGCRISLIIAFISSILNLSIGVMYGGVAGYFGGMIDNIMMRIADTIYTIPSMLYIILLTVVLGPGLKSIIVAITISFWITTARIVRGEIMTIKENEFALAAKELAPPIAVILRIIIPNCIGSILVTLIFSIPEAIFAESFLSFIGLGIPAPEASLGTLISDALESYQLYPSQLIFPSMAICLIIFTFNLLGDSLRDMLCNN